MIKKKRSVKEWDDGAESWVDFVRNGKDFFRDYLNNPGMFQLIGDVKDLFVLDVACGEGYNARILARKGGNVTGIDLSEELIKHAKLQEEKQRLGINYYVLDAAELSRFKAESFDLVTCFMALMDIENYDSSIREVARVMKNDGRFVFSITHPCFEYDDQDRGIGRRANYFLVRTEKIQWKMERLLRPFATTSFHRTITDYSNTLYEHGFLIRRLYEPRPSKEGPARFPPLKEVFLKPHSLLFETVKTCAHT